MSADSYKCTASERKRKRKKQRTVSAEQLERLVADIEPRIGGEALREQKHSTAVVSSNPRNKKKPHGRNAVYQLICLTFAMAQCMVALLSFASNKCAADLTMSLAACNSVVKSANVNCTFWKFANE